MSRTTKYERVANNDLEAENGINPFYQTTSPSVVSTEPGAGLTANQMAHLAEWDELNSFRDGIFRCNENWWPSCLLSFFCPYIHLGQLSRRLEVAPCWLPPLILFTLAALVYFFDTPHNPWPEPFYFVAWAGLIWIVRLKVRRYFRPNPGMLGDFNQLPGHLDDFCLSLWCGCCAIAQLSRHVYNYKLHGSSCSQPSVTDLDDGESLI
uniref:Uncharacterized protein n=1 Tax=Aureoumbra lagunensis TaxID=44058 RepID=A0A7S3JR56_9STRA|mmetsp:Transcript_14025/g.18718  ORF Transcript_14025/g.18718 Transcript_14025/m.18718 type:complete len:208 (+) Transcript_14025:57-680(+)